MHGLFIFLKQKLTWNEELMLKEVALLHKKNFELDFINPMDELLWQ
jgi:hypothetical protein